MLDEAKPKIHRGARHLGPRPPRLEADGAPKPIVLTDRDWDLYRAIVSFKMDHDGCAPQLREMMALAHMASTSVVTYHLLRLALAGLIEISPNSVGRRAGRIMVRGGRWLPPKPVGSEAPEPAGEQGDAG